MLDLAQLRRRCSRGEQFEYLFFWGHQPSQDGRITASCLSQWYASPFEIEGEIYRTAEHWMMACKARLFSDDDSDDDTVQRILDSTDPKSAKALGRGVRNFDGDVWNELCRGVVTEGNLAKFGQNKALRDYLCGTAEQVLVEASPSDRIWGIGLSATDERARHPDTWRGQNLLGFALMDVRAALMK